MRRVLVAVLGLGLAASSGTVLLAGSAGAASTSPRSIPLLSAQGTYVATTPTRVFDSRTTLKRQVKPGEAVSVPVLGKGGVPSSGVSAVVINLTATRAARAGYLTAYPSTGSSGGTSNVLFAPGESRASQVTVPVGSDGAIKVLDGGGGAAGPVDAIVDVEGYYNSESTATEGSSFATGTPYRLLDTRQSGGALKPNGTLSVTLDQERLGSGATALAINLTAASPTAPGYLTAWNGTDPQPSTSNVNFAAGQTTPNNAIVPLSSDIGTGETSFSVLNGSKGSTQVVVDVVGAYYDGPSGVRFQPLATPQRIVDSRTSTGTTKLGAGTTRTVQAPASVLSAPTPIDPLAGPTVALVGSLTAVKASASTFLTTYPTGEDRPTVSNLNPLAGQTVANHAVLGLSDDQFDLYNYLGSTDVLVDVTGRFEQPTVIFATLGSSAAKAASTQARQAITARSAHRFAVVGTSRR